MASGQIALGPTGLVLDTSATLSASLTVDVATPGTTDTYAIGVSVDITGPTVVPSPVVVPAVVALNVTVQNVTVISVPGVVGPVIIEVIANSTNTTVVEIVEETQTP